MNQYSRSSLEYLRTISKERFDPCRSTWIDLLTWAYPERAKWLLSQTDGQRNNNHLVDPSGRLALRSYVAGFSEGNTSATRPWFRSIHRDEDLNRFPANREWLDKYTRAGLNALSTSNFYHAAGQIYYDYGTVMTSGVLIEENTKRGLFFHNLVPGGYYTLNNSYGEAMVLVREMSLTVKALVDRYAKKKNGMWDWGNISSGVRKMYEDGNYTQKIDVVQVCKENESFDNMRPVGGVNRKWVCITYECGRNTFSYGSDAAGDAQAELDPADKDKLLEVYYSKRKPFIVARSHSSNNYEYGESGPTLDAIGCIKSMNKKALGKDQAIEQMLRPALQGPANLRRSYVTTAPNSYVPLDATSVAKGAGLKPIFEMNPAIAALVQDVTDIRQLVDRIYYADFLLYLSRNPKTRTAAEVDAIVQEQQLVIGPNLQSMNWTLNNPIAEFALSYALDNEPTLPPVPESLQGAFVEVDFISPFAQAQKAADLPSIDRYVNAMMNLVPLDPKVLDKVNLDRLADLYEDRLYLPVGLNRAQDEVDKKRAAAEQMARQQQMLQDTLPAVAGAAKDVGLQVKKQP